jgi:hypothetical protein
MTKINNSNNDKSINQDKTITSKDLKPYQKPELKHYGGISSLVQAVFQSGMDGGAAPFEATS